MDSTEQAILQALDDLDAAVDSMAKSQSKPDLIPLFERLDALARQLPQGANPELSHYLAKKSYQKARLLLTEEREKNGKQIHR